MEQEQQNLNITELKVNDVVSFENRLYRVVKSPYHKNKRGDETGLRVVLILLKQQELNNIILDKLNTIQKGG